LTNHKVKLLTWHVGGSAQSVAQDRGRALSNCQPLIGLNRLRLGFGVRWWRRLVAIAVLAIGPFEAVAGSLSWNSQVSTLKLMAGEKTAVTEFSFRNDTGRPVRILSVMQSCDCVTAKADKTAYAPGERGLIRAEFTVGGSEGRLERFIDVTTDETSGSPHRLRLEIELPEPVTLHPRSVFWRVGETAVEKEIEVVAAEPKTVNVGDVLCTEPAFSVRLLGDAKDGRYRVAIIPASTAKLAQATIRLNATVGGQSRVFVLNAAVK
jgi:hypothetical protein